MATTVFYTDKSGKAVQATFPSRALAEGYARTVKGARLVDSAASAPVVEVQKCPVATAEVQKAATNAYYRAVKAPPKPVREEREYDESYAERRMEHFADARAAGQAMEDAFSDWDYIQGY